MRLTCYVKNYADRAVTHLKTGNEGKAFRLDLIRTDPVFQQPP